MSSIQRVTVLGGGVLGGQIAWHSAFKGKTVIVLDVDDAAIGRCRAAHQRYEAIYRADLGATDDAIAATRSHLSYATDLAPAVASADLVIEAVPEVPELKTQIYRAMAPLLAEPALIATNSSTLLPSDFAATTGRPEKYCALHFANLIWRMNIAEIMAHATTATETLNEVTRFAIEIGMLPIPVQKEQNGYVLNGWFVALLNAAQTLVTNGISTPDDVDRTYLKCNPGAPMGPMAMIDMVGMRTAYNVCQHWGTVRGDEQMLANAEYVKTRFIDRGLLGIETGAGYYTYPNPAYQDEDFLAIPDVSQVAAIVARIRPGN